MQCLGTLVANSPYHRLKPGLLSRSVKFVSHFLNHKGLVCFVDASCDEELGVCERVALCRTSARTLRSENVVVV